MEQYEQRFGKFQLLQLLDNDVVEDPSTEDTIAQADDGFRLQSVPIPLTPLIGRESEMLAVRNLLQNPDVRLVTLIGAGGVGKTHLALMLGNALVDTFDNGAVFISLDTVYDSELVVPAIAQAFGLKDCRKQNSMQSLKTFLRDMHILLILDNFEQILLAAPHISELLLSCPQLKILVTSRSVLHVWGEHICRIRPLEIPDPQQLPKLESLAHVASIELFVQRAEAILPEFKLTPGNAQDIAEICKRLDGLPLALEQAAMHCNLLSPNAIASRLKHPIELLTGGRRDAPVRHHTLRNMLTWNDDLLTPDEHKLYRRLAIFEGFTLQTAEDYMSAYGDLSISTFEGITSLIDKSMLQQTVSLGEEPRLYFLEMLRAYGLELLDVAGETQKARNAHASYFVAHAESYALDTDQCIGQIPWRLESANLRAALEWLLEYGEKAKALRLVVLLEKIAENPEANEFLPSLVQTGKLDLANHQIFKPFDLDLLDLHSKEEHPNMRYRGAHELVIDLSHMNNTIPHRRNHMRGPADVLSTSSYEELTAREVEVLRLLAQGLSNKKIAEQLVLSPHTVSGHIQSIFGKLALNTRSAATRYALEHHLA